MYSRPLDDRRIVYDFRDIGRVNDNIGGNDLQMSFKVIERGINRNLIYELLLVVYSNFRRVTHRFRDVLMLKITICLSSLVLDLKFAVGPCRGNLEPKY